MSENKNAKTPADGPEYERGFVDGMQRQMQLHVNKVIMEESAKIFGSNLKRILNREDIIRMAREAGLAYGSDERPLNSVTRFAELVAAAEREACAKVCDVLAVHPEYASDIAKVAAQAIRARGDR